MRSRPRPERPFFESGPLSVTRRHSRPAWSGSSKWIPTLPVFGSVSSRRCGPSNRSRSGRPPEPVWRSPTICTRICRLRSAIACNSRSERPTTHCVLPPLSRTESWPTWRAVGAPRTNALVQLRCDGDVLREIAEVCGPRWSTHPQCPVARRQSDADRFKPFDVAASPVVHRTGAVATDVDQIHSVGDVSAFHGCVDRHHVRPDLAVMGRSGRSPGKAFTARRLTEQARIDHAEGTVDVTNASVGVTRPHDDLRVGAADAFADADRSGGH